MLADFKGRERRACRSRVMVVGAVPPRRAGRNDVQMVGLTSAKCSATSCTTR